MKKRILIIFSGVLLVGLVAAGSFKYYIKPNYVSPALTAMEELLDDEEMMDLLLEEYAVDQDILELADQELKEEKGENSKEDSDKNTVEELKENNNQADSKNSDKAAKDSSKEEIKKDTGGGKTVAELQKQVKPSDLSSGLKIASKIDTGHLMGLYRGGLTPENKSAAKSHLTSRLTSAEIAELRGLVGKYSHLLK